MVGAWVRTAVIAAVAAIASTGPGSRAMADAAAVASIKPVHSLAAAVMAGAGEPFLIVKAGASPHAYTMRPSEAAAIDDADVVFWVGPRLEAFLAKPLSTLGGRARVVALSEADGVRLLDAREGGRWETRDRAAHEHEDEDADDHGHDHGGAPDLHFWLDPGNATAAVRAIAEALAETDPERAGLYRANADETAKRIAALDAEIAATLAPVRDRPYVVFHDAYHYFERHYGLNAVGAITVAPGRNPGARRLYEIRDRIVELGAACVFAEPQFEPALVDTVIEGTGARSAVLDPLGADIPAGPELYFTLMRDLARGLRDCLGAGD